MQLTASNVNGMFVIVFILVAIIGMLIASLAQKLEKAQDAINDMQRSINETKMSLYHQTDAMIDRHIMLKGQVKSLEARVQKLEGEN